MQKLETHDFTKSYRLASNAKNQAREPSVPNTTTAP